MPDSTLDFENLITVITAVLKTYGEDGVMRVTTHDIIDAMENWELNIEIQKDPSIYILKATKKERK